MLKRAGIALLSAALAFVPVAACAEGPVRSAELTTKDALADAATIAAIIAASVAAYKAMGRPCACPDDRANNGSACGGRSAWSRPGGAKPLCFASDVTPQIVSDYIAKGVIPPLFKFK